MKFSLFATRITRFFALPSDNPELLKAQYRALSKQLPMMYIILVANTWLVAATHMDVAPVWMTVAVPLMLTLACTIRLLYWWRSRGLDPTPEVALRGLARTNRLAILFPLVFVGWSFELFHYGDAYQQGHLAFFMAITVITCIFCLMHLRSAAIAVTVLVNGGFFIFFALAPHPIFLAIAINAALVSVGILVILMINYRDFANMVNAQAETRRQGQEQTRLLHMIDNMPVAVMTVEPGTLNVNYANTTSINLIRSIEHLLPINADQLLGISIDIFHQHPEHQRRILADPANLPHNARIQVGPEVLDLKVSAVTGGNGAYLGPMLTWALVTKEVEAENRIRQLAHFDMLTDLPNRFTFRAELDQRLAAPGSPVGLLFIDLDGFKIVNDVRGHRIGDILLKQVADRLRATCNGPAISLGRVGGDEFAVLVPHNNAEAGTLLALQIIKALSAPYVIEHNLHAVISASIGIAFAPEHGTTDETLLGRADMALYAAKAAGKGRALIFSPAMERRLQERLRLEAKLRNALQSEDGLFVFYQPIVDIETGRVTAREALIRWHHPLRGWISPAEFIPIAEESGLIEELGQFVLNRACRDAAGWLDGARVAVNVSAKQLGKGTLPPAVLSALTHSGLAPERLEVEVTETTLLNWEQDALQDLRQLRAMGIRIALDDFGTGYSSLSHLRIFAFDKIKIDGSFVKDAVDRPDCAAIVHAIASLGKRLGVTTVAEGVETQEQLECIRREGCSEVQGYIFGYPTPSDEDKARVAALNPKLNWYDECPPLARP